MDVPKSSATRATPTTLTDLSRIRGDRGRFLRGLDLARRKPNEHPWAERPTRVGEGKYRVPSRSTDQRYLVDLSDGSCPCDDHHWGATCQHLVCAMILESRWRLRMARLVTCSSCPARVRYGDLIEVSDEHAEWGLEFFGGELLCPDCARRGGLR